MRVSVIIVNWNTRALTQACINSVVETARNIDCEIVVVDNCSSDGSQDALREDPRIRLIENDANLGFARASNIGMAAALGDIFLLLNSDTIVQPGAIERCADLLQRNPRVGLAACRLLNADGTLQRSCSFFPRLLTPLLGRHVLRRARRRLFGSGGQFFDSAYTDAEHLLPLRPDWVMGAFMMVRKSDLERVGPLDEGYFMYAEDMDWCFRFRKLNFEIAFLADVTTVHLGGASSRNVPRETMHREVRSIVRFMVRHRGVAYAYGYLLVSVVGLMLELAALYAMGATSGAEAYRTRRKGAAGRLGAYLGALHAPLSEWRRL